MRAHEGVDLTIGLDVRPGGELFAAVGVEGRLGKNVAGEADPVVRTALDQVVTVVMSYRAFPPVQDYLVIADETTLVYANHELRDHGRVLVPTADHGDFDSSALDRQDTDFFASILTGSEPVSTARSVRPAMAALQAAQDDLAQKVDLEGGTRA